MKPYYEEAGITLYCGDAKEIVPQLIGSFDGILTDPPYGIGKDYGEATQDTLPLFHEAIRLIVSLDVVSAVHVPASRLFDVPIRPQWVGVWNKPYGASGLIAYPFYPHWEALLFYHIKGKYAGNKGHRNDVFTFDPIRPFLNGHPTPKPLDLTIELLRFLPCHVVLDLYAGSGTTLLAAKTLGKSAIGIEIEQTHCQTTVDRLRQSILPFTPKTATPTPHQDELFTTTQE